MRPWEIAKSETRSFMEEPLGAAWVPNRAKSMEAKALAIPGGSLLPTEAKGVARARIAEAIRSAQSVVCVSSFLFADAILREALLEASRRGVRCYMLTMSEQHLLKESDQLTDFGRKQVEEHKSTLNALAGHVLVRTAPHFHSKFVVVDPRQGQRSRGFLSTANFTHDALTRNVELVLECGALRTGGLFEQFRVGFWHEAEHELLEPGRLEAVAQTGKAALEFVFPSSLPVTIGSHSTLRDRLVGMVSAAKDELWISTYGIDINHGVVQAVLESVKAGTRARVFLRRRDRNMPAAIALKQAGAEVYAHPFLHAKTVLAKSNGRTEGLIMTANFERRGLDEGFETGALLTEGEAGALETMMAAWPSAFEWSRLGLDLRRGDVAGPCWVWDGKKLDENAFGGTLEVDLGDVQASSVDSMDGARPQTFPEPSGKMPHTIIYKWRVLPPVLPKAAHPLRLDLPFAAYEHKGRKYLVVPSPEMVDQARPVAASLKAEIVAAESQGSSGTQGNP